MRRLVSLTAPSAACCPEWLIFQRAGEGPELREDSAVLRPDVVVFDPVSVRYSNVWAPALEKYPQQLNIVERCPGPLLVPARGVMYRLGLKIRVRVSELEVGDVDGFLTLAHLFENPQSPLSQKQAMYRKQMVSREEHNVLNDPCTAVPVRKGTVLAGCGRASHITCKPYFFLPEKNVHGAYTRKRRKKQKVITKNDLGLTIGMKVARVDVGKKVRVVPKREHVRKRVGILALTLCADFPPCLHVTGDHSK